MDDSRFLLYGILVTQLSGTAFNSITMEGGMGTGTGTETGGDEGAQVGGIFEAG